MSDHKKKPINFATDKNGSIIFKKGLTFKHWFKNVKMPMILDFVRWIIIDWYRGKTEKLFGVFMFCGLFGEGKTLSMVKHAEEKREKCPDVKIYSNFGYVNQDGEITKWQDLLELPHRSIVMIDEIQATFNSNDWKDFPRELLTQITQCRKREMQILCTAQIYRRVAIQIRELVQYVVQCRNIAGLGRMFSNKYFHSEDYEQYTNAISSGNKHKIQPTMRRLYIADDDMFNLYDTLRFVESLRQDEKKKENLKENSYAL